MRDVVLCADAREALAGLADASIDALVTDPPAGIGFMGTEWDTPGALVERKPNTAVAWDRVGGNHHACNASDRGRTARSEGAKFRAALTPIFAECERVLKPGHQALVWALPRTSHWTATALEDAGFYVADVITHHFGSGFPKSRSLLKPASEHWILCRAPGTLQPLQIDACRVPTSAARPARTPAGRMGAVYGAGLEGGYAAGVPPTMQGRWPPNAIFSHHPNCRPAGVRRVRVAYSQPTKGERSPDAAIYGHGWQERAGTPAGYADAEGYEQVQSWQCVEGCPVKALDEHAGPRSSGAMKAGTRRANTCGYRGAMPDQTLQDTYGDTGSASRFFPTFAGAPEPEDAQWVPFRYCAKASRSERNAGLEELPAAVPPKCGMANDPNWLSTDGCRRSGFRHAVANTHPTVKPLALMQWLVRLVTPPGGLVLDPFCGSGSTLIACVREGMGFIGIEQDEQYCEIARRRIAHEQEQQSGPLFASVASAGHD